MSKSEGQKMKLFALKDILEKETDATHGITMKRIIELLDGRGIKAERKSIYDDLRAFRDSEILDVTEAQGQNREYSVASRIFEVSELKMLIDAILASKFLSEKTTRDLIGKLESFCSKYEKKDLHRNMVIANRVKTIGSSNTLFAHVDKIHRAISRNAKISFRYFYYDVGKQKKFMQKGAEYIVSPWVMIYADDNYYLLAYTGTEFKHFRVDKMDDVKVFIEDSNGVEIVTALREGKDEFDKVDMSAYTKYTFSMYGGEITPVTMVFQNRMVGTVMDRFGKDVVLMKEDKDHFRITVPVAVSDQFFGWIFGLGNYVTIVGPEDVKEKMKENLAKVAKRYENRHSPATKGMPIYADET